MEELVSMKTWIEEDIKKLKAEIEDLLDALGTWEHGNSDWLRSDLSDLISYHESQEASENPMNLVEYKDELESIRYRIIDEIESCKYAEEHEEMIRDAERDYLRSRF